MLYVKFARKLEHHRRHDQVLVDLVQAAKVLDLAELRLKVIGLTKEMEKASLVEGRLQKYSLVHHAARAQDKTVGRDLSMFNMFNINMSKSSSTGVASRALEIMLHLFHIMPTTCGGKEPEHTGKYTRNHPLRVRSCSI